MRRTNRGRHLLVSGLLLAASIGTATSALAQTAATAAAAAPDGATPLHEAVRQNDLKAVEALIKRGADVKAATRYGVTPMSLAALNGNAAIMRTLLEAGADPNTATPGGETALMTAARTGNAEAVTLLLDRGANVNASDTVRAQTALMWAVTENHPDIVKLLAARGADVNARTKVTIPKGEYVPARAGGASGNGIIRQRALPKADGGMTPLLFAVRDGNVDADATVARTRRGPEAVVRQSHVTVAHRAPERTGRARDGIARAGRRPECRRRLPPCGAVCGDRPAQLQPRQVPVPVQRRARPARSDQGAAREGRGSRI